MTRWKKENFMKYNNLKKLIFVKKILATQEQQCEFFKCKHFKKNFT